MTINAVYPILTAAPEQVCGLAESFCCKRPEPFGAKSLVLCPLNDGSEVAGGETPEVRCDLSRRCFALYGGAGLVEPLGFPQSSLRSAAQAQTPSRDAEGTV